ncbi:MAG: hypothetical protein MJ123_02445 [Lachnospiraceae bacterium]|nr:hypothetical protein [Lachnospiraceae bacterium]
MGYGSYSASDWSKLKSSRKLSNNQNVEEVFKNRQINPKMDPYYIGTRECFDSEDHPNTTPIVVGLDVTGSMGYLAVEIATRALNELIMKLYSTGAVEDPALMCAAYGDFSDQSPLQVTQFESDIRIAEQLLEIFFENGGCGQVVPTCLWDFLSRHTNIDAINKRGKKGYVFTIGDAAEIRKDKVAETIQRVVKDTLDSNTTREDVLSEAEKKFNVFHLVVDSSTTIFPALAGHIMRIDPGEIMAIPEIVISTIQLNNGMDLEKVIAQWDEVNQPIVRSAIGQLNLHKDEESINF